VLRLSVFADPPALHQHRRYLHRVGRGAFAQVVGDDLEVEAVRHGEIPANAADEDLVAALDYQTGQPAAAVRHQTDGSAPNAWSATKGSGVVKSVFKLRLKKFPNSQRLFALFGSPAIVVLCIPRKFANCRR
jgi:hypothetical protein